MRFTNKLAHVDPLDAIAAGAKPPRPRPEPEKLDAGDAKTLERRMKMAVPSK